MGASPDSSQPSQTLMSFALPQGQQARRLKAAQLLEAVIDETLEPRMAINRWPESQELADPSLDCAYMALWHFEADETQQKTEMFYMDAQLELLRQIADHLKAARDLPPHILRTYQLGAPVRFYYGRSVWATYQQLFTHAWTQIKTTWLTAFKLIHRP